MQGAVCDRRDDHLVRDALGAMLTAPAPTGESRSGETVTLVVRPEMEEIDSPQAQVEGIVRRSAYLGNIVEYDVEVSGQMLTLVEHDPRRTAIRSEGQSVRIRFLEECLHVLPKESVLSPGAQLYRALQMIEK